MKISEKTLSLMRRIYGAVCSLMLALSAVLFIISAVTVNQSGSSPFTYESIGNAFSRIAVPVYVTLALLVVGGVFFGYFVTEGKERVKPPKDIASRLRRASRYADLTSATPAVRAKIKQERNMRLSLRVANAAYFTVGMVIAFLSAINPANYAEGISSAELTSSVLGIVMAAAVYVAPSAIMALLIIPVNYLSCEYELKLINALPKKKNPPLENSVDGRKTLALNCARIAIIALAVVFIILGVNNGGMEDVVQKAVKICTECIGLG